MVGSVKKVFFELVGRWVVGVCMRRSEYHSCVRSIGSIGYFGKKGGFVKEIGSGGCNEGGRFLFVCDDDLLEFL